MILEKFGCKVSFYDGQITVDATNAKPCEIPLELTGKLRSASLFIGSSLARFSEACQSLPGGCELGSRPIDIHLDAFSKMGAKISCENDMLVCKNCLHSTDVFLKFPSVGATENIIIASCLVSGITTITNAAKEPEIEELCSFINAMGGKIRGAGSSVIIIEGVEKLKGINYNIMGDRIEAATFLTLAMATDGEITVKGVNPAHLGAVTDAIVNCGGVVIRKDKQITVRRSGHFLMSLAKIETKPYPGFPTDAQSPLMAMLTLANGKSTICERMFDDRLKVAKELVKMGADITVSGNTAEIEGVACLCGTKVRACDLRSGAALVIAALSAQGRSVIENVCYIERGYADFVAKLKSLGADIIKTEVN